MPYLTAYPSMDYKELKGHLRKCKTEPSLFIKIVNLPFEYKVESARLFLGIISLVLVDQKSNTLDRIALSNTEFARNVSDMSVINFKDIKIDAGSSQNITAKAIRTQRPHDTSDWKDLLVPLVPDKQARLNQAAAGVSYSVVWPFEARNGGAVIYSYFHDGAITEEQTNFMKEYTQLVASVLEKDL